MSETFIAVRLLHVIRLTCNHIIKCMESASVVGLRCCRIHEEFCITPDGALLNPVDEILLLRCRVGLRFGGTTGSCGKRRVKRRDCSNCTRATSQRRAANNSITHELFQGFSLATHFSALLLISFSRTLQTLAYSTGQC